MHMLHSLCCVAAIAATATFNFKNKLSKLVKQLQATMPCCAQCDALKSEGAHVADSPSAVIAQCDVTYAMLSDPDAARSVATQADGVVEGIKKSPGKAYVDVSTVDEGTSREIAKAVTDAGGRYLEVCMLPPCTPCTTLAPHRSSACTLLFL